MDQDAETFKKHAFLMRTAELLHRYGTPSHRLERVMTKIAGTLQVPSVFLYTPTALVASLGSGPDEKTYMRRVDSGAINADKLVRFDEILERLEDGQISIEEAERRMVEAAALPAPYSAWLTIVACGLACAAVAVFFQGGWNEILAAGLLGLGIASLDTLQSKLQWENGLLFPVSGFLAALSALAIARWIEPIDDRLVTLAGLVVLLPGFTLTMALTELSVGHLSAGVARLAGACVTLLTLFLGVAIAWRVAGAWRTIPDSLAILPAWIETLAVAIAPGSFAILFRVRLQQWLVVFSVCWIGYWTSTLWGKQFGVEVGSFMGALAVGCGANFYARWRDRPSMVPLAPGMIMLVPGSLGYRSLSALLDRQTIEGVDFAFGMILVAMSLVGGFLASTALVPPKRIL